MTRIHPPALLLLLAATGALAPATIAAPKSATPEVIEVKVERLIGPVPEQVEAFDAAGARFETRMEEFREDAREYVDLVEAEKRTQIRDGYDRVVDGLRSQEDALRTLAKTRFEDFLRKYPDSEASPHVMFRLAELYYEDAENEFITADANFQARSREYNDLLDHLAPGADIPDPPDPAKKDYSLALDLYERIESGYPDYENMDGVYYMLGYCLTEDNALLRDDPRGLAALQKLVDGHPGSEFINDASMRLGEYYFNVANDLEQAIANYQRIVDSGETGRNFDKGLYKLAWSHYRLANSERFGEYDVALKLFVQLLDYSDRLMLSKGVKSAMKPEAIQYSAISFADMSDILTQQQGQPVSPLTVAQRFFKDVGQREYEKDIYIHLAEVEIVLAHFDLAIEVYDYLQQRWPGDPENPDRQYRIAQLYMTMMPKNEPASAEAERVLAERYSEGTSWWAANRANPDALAVARGFTEQSLANVAKDLHVKAQGTNTPEDYSAAADKYREYLLRFPFADDYYEMEWLLADALLNGHRLAEAEKEYLQLLKTTNHPYGDGALFMLMQARRQDLVDRYGKIEARPSNAIVERVDKTASGAEITVYMLTDEHKDFIEAADRVVATPFADPKFVGARDANLAALTYLPGQILFEFGHYDEALPRFEKVLQGHLNSKEATSAAAWIVRIWQERDDMPMILAETQRLQDLFKNAPVATTDTERQVAMDGWGKLEEGAAFKMALQFALDGKRDLAAEAFKAFCQKYPQSEYYTDAFFNWANNLELVGRVSEANTLFEQFIEKYPKDPRSEGYYFRIAGNYAQILEIKTALRYYDGLVKNFPKSQNAAAAIYNSAFLRIGIGEHEAAAEKLEYYATTWPDAADAEQAYYLAGNEWEQVGERQALDFYRRYLRRYGGQDVNHALAAQYRIIKILEGQKQQKNADREWEELERMYGEFLVAGKAVAGPGRHAAAEGAFRALWAQFGKFQEVKFTSDEEKDVTLLMVDKPAELGALVDTCLAFVQRYQDFEYSSAALYIQAAATFAYGQMIFDVPPPKGFNEFQIDVFRQQLEPYRVKVEDKGRDLALKTLETAQKAERWSRWQGLTLDLLNAHYPTEFPAEKVELRYPATVKFTFEPGPAQIDVPAPPPPAPTPASSPGGATPATPGGE
ncbi:MAG: tetratricopeptide repeat protein [Pseudomonadota bacterium]